MIELSDTVAPETVTITALVKVTREITVEARGEGHARVIAKDQASASKESHEWTCPDGTKTIIDAKDIERIIG